MAYTFGSENEMKRRWVLLIAIGAFLYVASYAYLRYSNIFIHRAGKYDFEDRHGERHRGRHFVQPGREIEGHQLFAIAITEVGEAGDSQQIQERLRHLIAESESRMAARRRIFLLYRPIAFVESITWNLVDPNPAPRPHESGQAESGPRD